MTIVKIAERAEKMKISTSSRVTLLMDIEYADEQFNLRLDELLNADDINFAHDVCGIQYNINHVTKEMDNFFVPRFAS